MPSGPKTNKYTNRHAEEARQRDSERAVNAQEAKRRAQEDAQWAETDKTALKRLERQREDERRAAERAAREAEKKDQLEREEAEAVKKAPAHVQRRMTQKELSKMLANYDKEQQAIRGGGGGSGAQTAAGVGPLDTQSELPTANPNKAKGVQFMGGAESSTITASGNPAEVLASLERQMGATGAAAIPENRHIGKRARVLYRAFCAEHLPTLKEERPNLRRTQYSDALWEMWQKSPQNPFVLRSEAADRARLEEERRWMEGDDGEDDDEAAEEGAGAKA